MKTSAIYLQKYIRWRRTEKRTHHASYSLEYSSTTLGRERREHTLVCVCVHVGRSRLIRTRALLNLALRIVLPLLRLSGSGGRSLGGRSLGGGGGGDVFLPRGTRSGAAARRGGNGGVYQG